MNHSTKALSRAIRMPMMAVALMALTACMGSNGPSVSTKTFVSSTSVAAVRAPKVDTERLNYAVSAAKALRAKGQKVWCVPFARNASGLEIRGDAREWWGKAKGVYDRGHEPKVGAVMAFSATRKNPRGHVAVVSEVISDREIRVNHANWGRQTIALGMKVVDISAKGDWSSVRLESTPGNLGRPYPITGFIYPNAI